MTVPIVPAMTPSEERALYENDHAAWCRYMAPRWIAMCGDDAEKKRECWRIASPGMRSELKRITELEGKRK